VALRRAFPDVRIAAGERVMTRWGFREWLETETVDVIQADIAHCGGISELLRIAACAEVYNVKLAPHNPYGPVAMASNLHACAAMQNFLILEHCRLRPAFERVQVAGPRIVGGYVHLSDAPGLGVELDWDFIKKNPFCSIPMRLQFDSDGALISQ
jgi:galactonate dehydratase